MGVGLPSLHGTGESTLVITTRPYPFPQAEDLVGELLPEGAFCREIAGGLQVQLGQDLSPGMDAFSVNIRPVQGLCFRVPSRAFTQFCFCVEEQFSLHFRTNPFCKR